MESTNMGAATLAVFDHTCGNNIQDSPAITFQALINVNVSHLHLSSSKPSLRSIFPLAILTKAIKIQIVS